MLLARRGHKVLLVDRSKFPSDVLHSTLYIHQPGCQLLRDWGLLDQVIATGCPPLLSWYVAMGPLVFRGSPPPAEGGQVESYAPRRYLLDQILADGAVKAGAEFRDGVSVEEIVKDGDRVTGIRVRAGGGPPVTETARIVIGADGIHSGVAAAVGAPEYQVKEARLSACYTYFSGVEMVDGAQLELYGGLHRAVFGWPTNDGKVLFGVNWQAHELEAVKQDLEGNYFSVIESLAPDLHRRLREGKREDNFIPGRLPRCFFRKPYGPGWALVGDAGCAYEYSTAQGITNALRQAQLAALAIDDGLAGRRPIEEALADFQRRRDDIELPYYDFTYNQATNQPIDPEALPLFAAVARSPQATSRFLGLFAQTTTPAAFFAPEHLGAIMSGQV
jgi:2-polyprenyl-6-methoxyphenol hydroxylase-like FAD-dependent oxidoreductase